MKDMFDQDVGSMCCSSARWISLLDDDDDDDDDCDDDRDQQTRPLAAAILVPKLHPTTHMYS